MTSNFGYPPGYVPPQQQPQYAPGYQPLPNAPAAGQNMPQAYAPAPQNHTSALADIENPNAVDDERFPRLPYAGGAPWIVTLVEVREQISQHPDTQGQPMVWITCDVTQSPDPAFAPGTRAAVKLTGFAGTMKLKAQGRLKAFVGSLVREDLQRGSWPAGHVAGRVQQAFGGQLKGAPFVVMMSAPRMSRKGNEYSIPNFYPVQP